MSDGSITTVDYETVIDRSPELISAEIKFIEKQVYNATVQGAIAIGLRLTEVKEKVGHGNFEQWCKENLEYSKRKAENFMRIAKSYGGPDGILAKTQTSADFSISKALSLLTLPEEDREVFMDEHDISEMSVRDMDEEIKKLKDEKEKAESALQLTEKSMKTMQEKLNALQKQIDENGALADTTEYDKQIEDLTSKIEKAKQKEQKLKADIQMMQNERKDEIDSAVAEARESLYEQCKAEVSAEIDRASELNAELQTENETLRRKLDNASDALLMKFKIAADQLQEVLEESDDEKREKMLGALSEIIELYK